MMAKVVMWAGRGLTIYQAERCLATLRDHGVDDSWTLTIDEKAESITAHPPRGEASLMPKIRTARRTR